MSRPRRIAVSATNPEFVDHAPGYPAGMELSLLVIIIGIVLAILVNYVLGIIVILIGLALLLLPRLRGGTTRRV
jgi:hypothetical protein